MSNQDKIKALKERQQNWMRERAKEREGQNDINTDERASNYDSKNYHDSNTRYNEKAYSNLTSVKNQSSGKQPNSHPSSHRSTNIYQSNYSSDDFEMLEMRCEVLNAEIDNINQSMNELSLRQSLQNKSIKSIEIEKQGIKSRILQLEQQLNEKDKEISQCTTTINDLEMQRSKYSAKIELIRKTLSELEANKEAIKSASSLH